MAQLNLNQVNLSMEQAVIAGLLAGPDAVYEVSGRLRSEMFSHPDLRFVYDSIVALASEGKPIDMLTVEGAMQRADYQAYQRLNGLSFLSDMLLDVRTDRHIRTHADELVRCYILRSLITSLQEKQTKALRPETDVTDLLGELDTLICSLQNEMIPAATLEAAGTIARRVLDQSYARQAERQAGISSQVPTGFTEWDDLTGGLYRKELTVIAGRPSMGKSAVALWSALSAARRGKPVAFFSVEMSKEDNTGRLLSMISGVDAGCLRFKGTSAADRDRLEKAQQELDRLPIMLEYCGSDTVEDMRAKAQVLHKQGKLGILYIDYLNLINIVQSKKQLQETTDLALGNIVRKIKLMAEEMDIPIVLLAQMNRESEHRLAPHFPLLSDLRNSGAIEQVADMVVFVYRAEKYGITHDPKTKADLRGVGLLLVAKNRNGSTGTARFRYNPAMTCMTDYDPKVI